ncbi:MAG: hypothetical protein R2867_05230 [Caldilineaceae bacterium]
MTVYSAIIDGPQYDKPRIINPDYQAENTALLLRLPEVLYAGESITVRLIWNWSILRFRIRRPFMHSWVAASR